MTYPATTPSRINPLLWIALALSVIAVAGFGYLLLRPAPAAEVSPEAQVWQSAAEKFASLPACSEVFVPDEVVDEAVALDGCKSRRGELQIIGHRECGDGRLLFQVDGSTGAKPGYGFAGEKYKAVSGEVAADRGYSKAVAACNS
jgi:hypothetical protein